jgi:hypothetical protein
MQQREKGFEDLFPYRSSDVIATVIRFVGEPIVVMIPIYSL